MNTSAPAYWEHFPDIEQKKIFKTSRLKVSDGHELTVYEAGPDSAETIIVVNPAVPFLMMANVAARLAEEYRVISWEVRGLPFIENSAVDSVDLNRLAMDLVDVWESHAADRRVHLVTASAGSMTVLWSTYFFNLTPASVCLFGPQYGPTNDRYPNAHSSVFLPLLTACSDDTDKARRVASTLQKLAAMREEDDLINRLLNLSFDTAERVREFGRFYKATLNPTPPNNLPMDTADNIFGEMCKKTRVAIFHCQADELKNYQESVDVHLSNPETKLVVYPGGGHYSIFRDGHYIGGDILNFIRMPSLC